ncbi:acyltransferase [Cellulomonas sp. KRMCY2]|uniref:acyltransferase family protein n=1 Tax=Cellulomonas sp. KRMCY2 TaxID=1304865 RepID=UPI00045EA98A|nr:acyltransferase [Cellulomonas sp. KRMCY2]
MTAATEQEAAPTRQSVFPGGAPEARLWRWTGHQLDPRRNSLNLIRLVLATMVLVAHAYYIAGVQSPNGEFGPHIDGENLGGWAVFGFFAVSGYLITASRWSNSLGTYLVHRIARIFPAFLVCLVVMAVVFGPIGYWHVNGSLAGYFTTGPTTPINFVFSNAMLRVNSYEIAGTPAGVPYPGAWNGSLWTLYYEFLAYLIVGALAVVGWVRRSPLAIGVVWFATVAGHALWGRLVAPLVGGNLDVQLLLKLLPLFLGGALVQLLRHRLPLHWAGAALSVTVVLGAIWAFDGWGAQLTAPFIAYLLLWIGSVVPSPRTIQRHDISYGVYIYAFPVQQLLVLTGIHNQGLLVYDVVALACTVPLAIASWLLIERPIMRRARRTHGRPPAVPAVPTVPTVTAPPAVPNVPAVPTVTAAVSG